MLKERKYSLWSIVLIFAFIIGIFFYFDLYKRNRIVVDAPSYYAYLPATFIYKDLHLNFIDKNPQFFKDKIWYYTIEENKRLIKCTSGVSLTLLPFFAAGHIIAGWMHIDQSGYSMPYQNAMSIGVLLYLLAGLYYLRKVLLKDFSEGITAITLISVVLGTNLLWYSTFEGLMSHAISFSLLCGCMYMFGNWLKKEDNKSLVIFSILFGVICLIRPLAVTILIYFFIIALYFKGGMAPLMKFLRSKWRVLIFSVFLFVLIVFIQSCYWKYSTGHWMYDVYIDEHFIFSSPQIFLFLFSFRKGIFVYTPILIIAVLGLIILFRNNRALFYATTVLMIITIYILSSWWAWSYGISWGIRPMVDYYSILAIPLAGGFQYLFSKGRIVKFCSCLVISLLILLNLFQTWQYKNGLIHYDDMTREAYFKGFLQTKPSVEWQDLLRPYDWERRIKGLPQIEFSQPYFQSVFKTNEVYLRSYNQQFPAFNPRAQYAVAAFEKAPGNNAMLKVEPAGNNKVYIRTKTGAYWSVNNIYDNLIMANIAQPGPQEMFTFEFIKEDDNRIAIKAANGNYITVGDSFPYLLLAKAPAISPKETFRLFVKE